MRLDGIQMGRAIAALMVVVFHANVFYLPDRLYDGGNVSPVLDMGYSGVEFFFVLSGFIMYLVHRRDFGRPERAKRFLWKRLVRIYPLLWFVSGGAIMLATLSPDASRPVNAWTTFTVMTLWPTPQELLLTPAWTLQHEMLFYLMFMLFIVNLRLGLAIFLLWVAGCAVMAVSGSAEFPLSFLFAARNLLFAFGLLAGVVVARSGSRLARLALLCGAALFLFVGVSEAYDLVWDFSLRTVAYGVGASLMVVGLAGEALPPWRPLVFLGDASYSVYLVHVPAMSVATAVLVAIGAPWGLQPLVMFVLLCCIGTFAGIVVHLIVERPVLRFLRKPREQGRRQPPGPEGVAG